MLQACNADHGKGTAQRSNSHVTRLSSISRGNLFRRAPNRTYSKRIGHETRTAHWCLAGEGLVLSPQASSRGWVRHAWLLPAALAAAAICLLCWGAWVYGYDPRWLSGSRAWWRPILQTDQDWTLVVTMALLLGGLGAYWWPRRRAQPPDDRADRRRRARPGGRGARHGLLPPVPRSDEQDGHHVLDPAALRGAAAEHLPERAARAPPAWARRRSRCNSGRSTASARR